MIDLGIPGSLIDLDRPPPWPRPGPGRSRWLAVLVVLVAVLAAGGSVTGPGRRLVRLTEVPTPANPIRLIDGGDLFVAGLGPAGNTLTGYHLPDGNPLWSAPLHTNALLARIVAIDGTLLVVVADAGDATPHTIAVDRSTGAHRWSDPGWAVAALPAVHRVLLVSRGEFASSLRLRGAVPATGTVTWTYRGVGSCQYVVSQRDTAAPILDVLCATPGGALVLTRLDPSDGLVLARRDLTPPASAGGSSPFLTLAGGELLLAYGPDAVDPSGSGSRIEAYDPYVLTPQWTHALAGAASMIVSCDTLVCVTDRHGTSAIVPSSGAVRWRGAPPSTAISGRLLWTYEPSGLITFLSLATGRPALSLPHGWRVLRAPGTGPGWLTHWDRHTGHTSFALLEGGDDAWWRVPARAGDAGPLRDVVQPGPGQDGAGRDDSSQSGSVRAGSDRDALAGSSPPAPARLLVLGGAPDVDHTSCQVDDGYLSCRTIEDTLRIWRYQR